MLAFSVSVIRGQDYKAIKSATEYTFIDSISMRIIAISSDSVKTVGSDIHYFNFKQFLNYVQFFDICGKSDTDTGITNLTTLKIYDYQPGDEFHIVWHDEGFESTSPKLTRSTIQRILERIDSPNGDSVTYLTEVCESSYYTLLDSAYYCTHIFDTLTQTFSAASTFLEKEPLEPVLINSSNYWSYTFMGFLNDPAIPFYDIPFKAYNSLETWVYNEICFAQLTIDMCNYDLIYFRGLGGPYFNCMGWKGWGHSYNLLKYYKKDNITWGTPLKCDSLLQVGLEELHQSPVLRISPNPTGGIIRISLPGQIESARLEIVDISGKRITFLEQARNIQYHDISFLPSGIYLLTFTSSKGERYQTKLIRQ